MNRYPSGLGLKAIDSHTEGEPTRIVTAGLPEVPGATMLARREWLRENLDHVRTALIREPRGHDALVMAYLLPAVTPGATTGVVFTNSLGYLNMCGHGAIGVATVLVRMGMVEVVEPVTRVVLDTPPGTVELDVHVTDGRPTATTLFNVPSFLLHADLEVRVAGGSCPVDVAYGGNWFGLIDRADTDLPPVGPENLGTLMRFCDQVRTRLREQGVAGFDPQTGIAQEIDHIEVFERRELPADAGGPDAGGPDAVGYRTMTLCPGWAFDRSPCGTGTSAKLATLVAKGRLPVSGTFRNQSVLGTEFEARVVRQTEVRGHAAIVPGIRGSAWVTGVQEFVLDDGDPWAHGLPMIREQE